MPKAISGAVITKTMYVHAMDYYDHGVTLFDQDMSKNNAMGLDYICLGPVEITFKIPEFGDLTDKKVEILKDQITKMNAEHYVKVQNIEDQIQRLLCIGHDPEPLPFDDDLHF